MIKEFLKKRSHEKKWKGIILEPKKPKGVDPILEPIVELFKNYECTREEFLNNFTHERSCPSTSAPTSRDKEMPMKEFMNSERFKSISVSDKTTCFEKYRENPGCKITIID